MSPEIKNIETFPLIYNDRDFLLVRFVDDTVQPFYRSSGRNSGMPGTWLPFDGIIITHEKPWFNKRRFCNNIPEHLRRFGSDYYKLVSQHLDSLHLPYATTITTDILQVNELFNLDETFLAPSS